MEVKLTGRKTGRASFEIVFPRHVPRSNRDTGTQGEEVYGRAILASLPGLVILLDCHGDVIQTNSDPTRTVPVPDFLTHLLPGDNYFENWSRNTDRQPRHANGVAKAVRAVASGAEDERSVEYSYGSPGDERWLEVRAHRLRSCEGGVLVTHSDITVRKRSETLLRGNLEEMFRLDRVDSMCQLTGSLAHEISEPLAAIMSNAEAARLQVDSFEGDMTEVTETLADIINDASRADSIIRNVRALLKNEKLPVTPISVNEAAAAAAELVARRAQQMRVTLDVYLAPDLPPVLANKIQLQQVALNLATNGLDAMASAGGKGHVLSMRTSFVPSKRSVTLKVCDTGKGVAMEDLKGIFEPFKSSKSKGLGLGLAICRSIVEAAGGTIQCEPRESEGETCFTVTLPGIDSNSEQEVNA